MAKCAVCGKRGARNPAPSKLTPEEKAEIQAYHASFWDSDGNRVFHTGHLRPELMELPPSYLCDAHKVISDVLET